MSHVSVLLLLQSPGVGFPKEVTSSGSGPCRLLGLMEGLRRGLLHGPSEGAEHRGCCRVRVIGNCSLSWLYFFFF